MDNQQELFHASVYARCIWCYHPMQTVEDTRRDHCDATPPLVHLEGRSKLRREYEAELVEVNRVRIASGLEPLGGYEQ